MKATTPTERIKQLLPQLFTNEHISGTRYLLFQITAEVRAAIPLSQVWEATILPATAITPLPQVPSSVLGLHSGRDRVYCVIELGELLGLVTPTKIPQQYPVIVVQVSPPSNLDLNNSSFFLIGLAVNRILRTVAVNEEEIISPIEEFPAELTPYLQGCLQQDAQQIAVLDLTAITDKIS
jgi:twitching motility protein PilI